MLQLLKNYLWHLPKAVIASMLYSFPATELVVIGVTGTKGKTTTCHLIYHMLKETGHKVGLISSVGAFFGNRQIDTGLHVTSPDAVELQRLLRLAVTKGINEIVLEVTSNGIDQFRVWGVPFKIGVLTNIYSDHLDYHKTMKNYIGAKKKLIALSDEVVINRSINNLSDFERVARQYRKSLHFFAPSSSFEKSNQEAAIETVRLLGISRKISLHAIRSFPGVSGRMEVIQKKPFMVIIDFAHTPESLEAALHELRTRVQKNGRLIAVFGCAGERDPGRRKMGAVAAKLADFFVITAEDPRTESVEQISSEIADYAIKAGAKELEVYETSSWKFTKLLARNFVRIPDRQEAINYAISLAKEGDVIGLFGKGHEKSMCYGHEEKPWSEYEAVRQALLKTRKTRSARMSDDQMIRQSDGQISGQQINR